MVFLIFQGDPTEEGKALDGSIIAEEIILIKIINCAKYLCTKLCTAVSSTTKDFLKLNIQIRLWTKKFIKEKENLMSPYSISYLVDGKVGEGNQILKKDIGWVKRHQYYSVFEKGKSRIDKWNQET